MTHAALTATVDPDGQVTLPREVAERLHLRPGDQVHLRLIDDQTMEISAAREIDPMSLAGSITVDFPITLEGMEDAIARGASGT